MIFFFLKFRTLNSFFNSLGITARKLCLEELDDLNEEADEVTILYAMPENLLEEKFRCFLLDKFQERIIAIVVDEAHLVTKW